MGARSVDHPAGQPFGRLAYIVGVFARRKAPSLVEGKPAAAANTRVPSTLGLDPTESRHVGAKYEEVAAQAAVTAVNDQLDDLIKGLAKELLRVVDDDIRSPRYLRYFSDTPSAIARLGLESELARVRGWVDSLCSEPETALQELGARLRKVTESGDQVLERRRKAEAARSDHRVRSITSLVEDINNARRSLYGVLTKKAADNRLPREWADRFFRHTSRETKTDPPPAPSAPGAA